MRREMIVTDVTRMAAPRVCVAGFFSDDGVAVRPVMPYKSRKDITEEFLWKGDLQIVRPFAEVRLGFTSATPDPPHTEDWEIHPLVCPELVRFLSPEEKQTFLEDHLDPCVESIFGAPIQEDRYICKGEGVRSLGTVLAKRVSEVTYSQKQYEGEEAKWEYRIRFTDASRREFSPAVTDLTFRAACDHLREHKGWDLGRISGWLTKFLGSARRKVYLRIGLARAWEKHPDRCYLQVTGVYSFPDYLGGKALSDLL